MGLAIDLLVKPTQQVGVIVHDPVVDFILHQLLSLHDQRPDVDGQASNGALEGFLDHIRMIGIFGSVEGLPGFGLPGGEGGLGAGYGIIGATLDDLELLGDRDAGVLVLGVLVGNVLAIGFVDAGLLVEVGAGGVAGHGGVGVFHLEGNHNFMYNDYEWAAYKPPRLIIHSRIT